MNRPSSRRRRGSAVLEAMLVLPILILVALAIFQFGVAMIVEQAVGHAATVAAREAGKGASLAELGPVVEEVLAPHGLSIGSQASLVLENGRNGRSEQLGTYPCVSPREPGMDASEVRVTVCVNLGQPPLLNALASYGIDFSRLHFQASTVTRVER